MAQEVSTDVQSQSGGLLQQIIAASTNKEVDAGKMQAMANLAIQLQDREQQAQFNRDYNAAVFEMPVISKDGRIIIRDKNTQQIVQSTPFAKFEDLDRIVRPIARRHNIAYTFEAGGTDTRITVRVVLRHVNGYVHECDALPLPLETSGSKNNVQGVGSSVTYGKRYALQNAFAIVAEGVDLDGHDPANVVTLPHEREQLVLREAQEAADADGYQGWFERQSPKDRAWLVARGHHAQFGGAALPAPQQAAGSAETHAKADAAAAGEAQRWADWVKRYVANVDKVADRDTLMGLQTKHTDKLAAIRESWPDLQQQVLDAHQRAMGRFQ